MLSARCFVGTMNQIKSQHEIQTFTYQPQLKTSKCISHFNACEQDFGVLYMLPKSNTEIFNMTGFSCKTYFKALRNDTIYGGDRISLMWPYLTSKININLSVQCLYVFYYFNKCFCHLSQVHYQNNLNSNH